MKKAIVFFYLILFLLLIVCITGCTREINNTEEPIAILGAFADEIQMLEDSLENKQIIKAGGIRFITGRLKDQEVVMAFTGIGKVNAAMTTTLLIDHFNPSKVIFTGIAGGLNPVLKPTDVIIAKKCVQHDLNFIYPDTLVSYSISSPITGKTNPIFYESDSSMFRILGESLSTIKLKLYEIGGQEFQPKVLTGIIATGDVFVASEVKKKELINQFMADAVEMEGAAVAQICYQYNLPFIIIRSISDSADKNANLDVEKFLNVASENANRVVLKLLESM